MLIYRIADCKYIDDLSGKGAALYGGRWNNIDTYMVYAAATAALAMLEAVVHMGKMPDRGYCMITLEIPDNKLQAITPDQLPPDWHLSPAPDHLKKTGDAFISSMQSLAMKVPSVLIPEETNILINPNHPDFKKVKIIARRSLTIDERLLHATGNK